MTLTTVDAEAILRARLGEPAKPATDYVVGFKTASGKVLAIHREARETRIWFQPPQPPSLAGVSLMDGPSNGNSNLNGPLLPLQEATALRAEVDSSEALHRFLDWYSGDGESHQPAPPRSVPRPSNFKAAFKRFQDLVQAESGHPFRGFDEGRAAAWESYKPRLRNRAISLLGAEEWYESEIGSGAILSRVIKSIEIQDSRLNLTNNLVFWQNRFGHAHRDHRVLLEATSDRTLCRKIEGLLFGLYRGNADEGSTFDQLSTLTGGKYPLSAYLFFLKDVKRFMPIQPTGFDRAFRALGIDFSTLRQCNWQNYSIYNGILEELRAPIAAAAALNAVDLIDAHSFVWIFTTLIRQEIEGTLQKSAGAKDAGRVLGSREKSIAAMRYSVEETVRSSNGQIVERTIRNKDLRMNPIEFEKLLATLLDVQNDRCALTGIPFHYIGADADKNLLPSADRIDSSGHYEAGNIQIVCRFINFWKGAQDNEEFKRLMMLVRREGLEAQ